jgi:hypothetical protein
MATKAKAKSKKSPPKKAALQDLRVGKAHANKVQGGATYGPETLLGRTR